MVACFWLIFYSGVTSGGMGDVVDNISNKDGHIFLKRIIYDMSFFIWVRAERRHH